jgi:hypothetical protein
MVNFYSSPYALQICYLVYFYTLCHCVWYNNYYYLLPRIISMYQNISMIYVYYLDFFTKYTGITSPIFENIR